MEDGLINFNQYEETVPIIKVIGVGGGGGNAVEYMCEQGIRDVDFVLCNTDKQVVEHSKVPTKIQLGKKQTQGLGAGNRPEWGEAAAIESEEEIREVLSKNTKMVFITAAMGGGTGTGAAPVIARLAKEMGILTVGIVTVPAQFEGESHRFTRAVFAVLPVGRASQPIAAIINGNILDDPDITEPGRAGDLLQRKVDPRRPDIRRNRHRDRVRSPRQ